MFCRNCGVQQGDQAAFCTGCGAAAGAGNKFCGNCGNQVDPAAAVCVKCGVALYGGQSTQPAMPGGYRPPVAGGFPPPGAPGGYPGAPPVSPHPGGYGSPFGGPVAAQMIYAPWATRVLGYLIDAFLVGIAMVILYVIAGGMLAAIAGSLDSNAGGLACCMFILLFPLSTLLVGLFNRVYLISTRGCSIGQGVVKVKVVDGAGNLLTTGTAFIRLLAQAGMGLVPFLPLLDLLWPLWDERRQTLHDKAVGSYVINQ